MLQFPVQQIRFDIKEYKKENHNSRVHVSPTSRGGEKKQRNSKKKNNLVHVFVRFSRLSVCVSVPLPFHSTHRQLTNTGEISPVEITQGTISLLDAHIILQDSIAIEQIMIA